MVIEAGSARGSSGGSDIRSAVEFLREARGLLQVEDILPFFPDFVHIDDFKDAICTSLEDYNEQIEGLKSEMEEATRGAELLRNDISLLGERNITVHTMLPARDAELPYSAVRGTSRGATRAGQQLCMFSRAGTPFTVSAALRSCKRIWGSGTPRESTFKHCNGRASRKARSQRL